MAISDALEDKLLLLFFANTDAALIGDAAGLQNSATAGSVFISLHTADPTDSGTQASSEATYTSYARVTVARAGAQWAIAATGTIDNTNAVTFPAATGGSETITHVGIGEQTSGANELWWSGALAGNLAVVSGVTPSFAAGELNISLD